MYGGTLETLALLMLLKYPVVNSGLKFLQVHFISLNFGLSRILHVLIHLNGSDLPVVTENKTFDYRYM